MALNFSAVELTLIGAFVLSVLIIVFSPSPRRPRQNVAANMQCMPKLLTMSAVELSMHIKQGKISCREVVRVFLAVHSCISTCLCGSFIGHFDNAHQGRGFFLPDPASQPTSECYGGTTN
jgi:hypothetical protein